MIVKRKKEYQKIEGENSELLINSFGYSIGAGHNGLTVKKMGKNIKISSTANIEHITILSNGVSLSSNAIQYCARKSIPIDFFDNQGKHIASLMSTKYASTSIWDKQMGMSNEMKSFLGAKIIYGKLKNQLHLIKYYHKYHKEEISSPLNVVFEKTTKQLLLFIQKAKEYTFDDNFRENLMGYESQGALAYWEYIRALTADDTVSFLTRERKGATDLFNSLLNYGYSIIYSRVWQSVLRYKLNPTLGIIHLPQQNKPVLVYDIIELFRSQAVDRVVISLVQKGEPLKIKDNKLEDKTKALLIENILERLHRYEKYRGIETCFEDIIKSQVRDIALYITENKPYKPYISKW